jgi:hypothetical protein
MIIKKRLHHGMRCNLRKTMTGMAVDCIKDDKNKRDNINPEEL